MTRHSGENGASGSRSRSPQRRGYPCACGRTCGENGGEKTAGGPCGSRIHEPDHRCYPHTLTRSDAERLESYHKGSLQSQRRGRPIDVVQAVEQKIFSLEEIAGFQQTLLTEIRGGAWSHGDAALQVSLLQGAIRRADALEKLKHARDVLIKGRRTAHIRFTIDPSVMALAAQYRPTVKQVGTGTTP